LKIATDLKTAITHPERVLWPDPEITKQQLVDHYISVGDLIVPELEDRLLTLKRAPGGIDGEIFFQKNAPKYTPEWIRTEVVPAPSAKRDVSYLVCDSVDTLIWIANQSGVELHVCLDRVSKRGKPDLLVFDLDPIEGRFDLAVEGAFVVRKLLQRMGLEPLVKTTGGKGVHVYVRLERRYPFQQVHQFAMEVGQLATQKAEALLTLEFKKSDRSDRVLIDVHRNGPGATIVAPFSPRARAGGPISLPVTWSKLAKVQPEDFNLLNAKKHLKSRGVEEFKAGLLQKQRLPKL
jgi:bifunctional non-homologous end joining protein LigD